MASRSLQLPSPSAYKGVVISPSLTKTAGGKDLYIPLINSGDGGDVIPDNVTIAGTLGVVGATTLQSSLAVAGPVGVTGAATLGSSLAVAGTLGVTGAATLQSSLVVGASAVAGTSAGTTAGVITPNFSSVVLPSALLTGSLTAIGPTFLRPCLVIVSVLATTTPTGAGGITQNRQFGVSLTFTNTGANQLTDYVVFDSAPGGAGSNIGYSFTPATGRFSFSSNATPIEPTAFSFAILNQV